MIIILLFHTFKPQNNKIYYKNVYIYLKSKLSPRNVKQCKSIDVITITLDTSRESISEFNNIIINYTKVNTGKMTTGKDRGKREL